MVMPLNGLTVALSLTLCPAASPLIVGASLILVLITVAALLLALPPTVSVADTVNTVASVLPTATRLSVGSNTSTRMAVVAWAAVPDAGVNTPLAAESSVTLTLSVCAGLSTSPMVIPLNGLIVALSFTAWPDAAPPIVGASFMLVLTTVVTALLVDPLCVSVTTMLNPLVSV